MLLLDEPFGALDAKVRRELRMWLRRLHDEIHVACVFVTHDQEEAMEVSDRVAIMDQGRIEQVDTPDNVYEHPANAFVYSFLGNVNLFHGRVRSGKAHIGALEVDAPEHQNTADAPAVGFARPHEMEIVREKNGSESIEAVIAHIQSAGPSVKLQLTRTDNGQSLEVELTKDRQRELNLKAGESVFVKPRQVRVFIETPDKPLNYQI